MFINLSQVLIDEQRNNILPSKNEIVFEKCKISNSYNDTKINISLRYFEEKNKKKLIKQEKNINLKYFFISSEEMKAQIISAGYDIDIINEIIRKNDVHYEDINASSLFGPENTLPLTLTQDKYNLEINFNTFVPSSNIEYVSVGYIFYIDYRDYCEKNNLEYNKINKSILNTGVQVIDLYNNLGKPVEANKNRINDLRTVKNIFKNNEKINKLYESINLTTTVPKNLSQVKNITKRNRYFSDLYISRSFDNLNLMFNFDFISYIKDNSYLNQLISDYNIEQVIGSSRIVSFTFMRREFQNFDGRRKYINKPHEIIANGSYTSEGFSDPNIHILNIDKDYRTFYLKDNTAYDHFNSSFQYGIKLKILDSYILYLQNFVNILREDVYNLKQYLQNLLRKDFLDTFSEKLYEETYAHALSYAVSHLVFILEDLNIITDEEKPDLISSLATMLNPETCSEDTIYLVINIFNRLIRQIDSKVKSSSGSVLTVEHWFKETFDAINQGNVGYVFFNQSLNNDSLVEITDFNLNEKINSDITKYTKFNDYPVDKINEKFSFIAPIGVNLLDNFNNFNSTQTTFYNNLESKIVKYKDIKKDKDLGNVLDSDLTAEDIYDFNINKKSAFIHNRFLFQSDDFFTNFRSYGAPRIENKNINLEFLNIIINRADIVAPLKENNSYYSSFYIKTLINKQDSFFSPASVNNDLENISKFMFLYDIIHEIEYLHFDQTTGINGSWQKLTFEKYNTFPQNKKVICRLRKYIDPAIDRHLYDIISLPVYSRYFIFHKTLFSSTNLVMPPKKYPPPKPKPPPPVYKPPVDLRLFSPPSPYLYHKDSILNNSAINKFPHPPLPAFNIPAVPVKQYVPPPPTKTFYSPVPHVTPIISNIKKIEPIPKPITTHQPTYTNIAKHTSFTPQVIPKKIQPVAAPPREQQITSVRSLLSPSPHFSRRF